MRRQQHSAARVHPAYGPGATRWERRNLCLPRHNGKVGRYQRILAEELLYARNFTSEDVHSTAIGGPEHPLQLPSPATREQAGSPRRPDCENTSPTSSPNTPGPGACFGSRSAAFSSPRCRRSAGHDKAVTVVAPVSVEERVGACSGVGEVSGVGVQVAAGRLDRFVAEDALEDMEGDAGVGEPGRSGMAESVPGEAG